LNNAGTETAPASLFQYTMLKLSDIDNKTCDYCHYLTISLEAGISMAGAVTAVIKNKAINFQNLFNYSEKTNEKIRQSIKNSSIHKLSWNTADIE